MINTKINILGTEYEIITQSENDNPKLKENNGLCECFSKKIVLNDMEWTKEDVMAFENIDEFKKKVLRHEIIHAFFTESGLMNNSDYAENEELVDWIAIQSPKFFKVFEKLGVL